MTKDNPMDKLVVIEERLREKGAALGLELESIVFIPANEQHPHLAQAIYALTDDAFKTDEQKEFDDQFKQMAAQAKVDDMREKVEHIKSGAADLLNMDDGILEEGDGD